MADKKKIKVKLAVGARRYRVIEVDEDEVETVKKVNRLIWRETDREKRERLKLQKENITLCSLSALDEGEERFSLQTDDALSDLLEEEQRKAQRKRVFSALSHLNSRQREMVRMVYYEEKTQEEVARHFGITKSAVSHAMGRIYERMKKFL